MLKIQKIQRRVRAWLLKRQNNDIESASEILHSAFMSDSFKKKADGDISVSLEDFENSNFDKKEAIILIQRTVKNWLIRNKD